ncbi:helix-hairpin-helix domain-containing protein [Massilia solisilvae]|uniref:Helix-hairpin-helix domain-containing protein n=1 Tax=Massilia solisilvae TaxID=1811225 RepID=A0ABT2BKW2_9BURK|nr:helix-hairpin-helix domain-containing protein [Massilia solisilvae]MCS0609095.1 helix-hairpin-helix domain-containing protein [Massilia solisilvae]
MNPSKVMRERVRVLTDLPNIGAAGAKDLQLIGIREPTQLIGKSPFDLYQELCLKTGVRHDPCVLDVFMSITSFMAGDEPRPWWYFTPERKRMLLTSSAK